MTRLSRLVHEFATAVQRVVPRIAALITGFIMTFAGLAMTASIVLLPAGVVIGLLGVAFFVAGIFVPDMAHPADRHR